MAWTRVSSASPCRTCGKSDWCSVHQDGLFTICRRVNDGTGRVKVDRAGAEYWVYAADSEPRARPNPNLIASPAAKAILDLALLDRAYTSILRSLRLTHDDRLDLRARGLGDEVVRNAEYRSFSKSESRSALGATRALLGDASLLQVPGIARGADGELFLTGAAGLVLPVRDAEGRVVALKARRRSLTSPRYLYWSSTSFGGPGPGSPPHVPFGIAPSSLVRLTEGELKADVATTLSATPTVSIAGVGSWRAALPVLRRLGVTTCRLAFDADARTNPFVARALHGLATHLVAEGLEVEIELWDPRFKGIDDALRAGQSTRVIAGADARRMCAEFVERATEFGASPRSA